MRQLMMRLAQDGVDTYTNIKENWSFEDLLDWCELLEYQTDLEIERQETQNKE